jgi:hypothetical protein
MVTVVITAADGDVFLIPLVPVVPAAALVDEWEAQDDASQAG